MSKANAEALVALVNDAASLGIARIGFESVPVFDFQDGLKNVVVRVYAGTNLYATGHQWGPVGYTDRRVEFYDLDNFGSGDSSNRDDWVHSPVLGVRADGTAFGVLFDLIWASSLSLGRPLVEGNIRQIEGPAPRVSPASADTPQGVAMQLTELTGHPFAPPIWSIGYRQSKHSYFTQQNVLDIGNEFGIRRIRAEVIWMDIDSMYGFRNFTFNPFAFPNPLVLKSDNRPGAVLLCFGSDERGDR